MTTPWRQHRRSALTALAIVAAAVSVGAALASTPAQAHTVAPVAIQNDTATKTVTMRGGDFAMAYDYDGQSKVSSFTMGGDQLLNGGMYSTVQVDGDGSTLDSRTLTSEPTVKVHGNSVTASFVMSNNALSVAEQWHFVVTQNNVHLKVSRTYDWTDASDLKVRHNGMLTLGWARIWDNIRRPQDGGDLPIGNAYTGSNNFFLSQANDRYGVEESDFVMLKNSTHQALDVDATSNRNLATEFSYTGDGNTYQETQLSSSPTWSYRAGSAESGLVYGGHSSNGTDAYIYAPVTTTQKQTDSVDYVFKADDYSAYYSLGGTVNGLANTAAVSSLLNDFGRSGVIDKGYGMSTVGLRYPGVGPYDMVYADRTVEGYFDPQMTKSQENLLTYFKNDAQSDSGHMDGRTFHLDTPWGTNSLYDADPSYAMAVADMYQYSADTSWLTSMRSSVEKSLAYMVSNQYSTQDALFHNDVTSCTSTKGEREWNDGIYVKYESGYVNELMYEALTEWSTLEATTFHNSALATSYSSMADQLKTAFNKDADSGGLWEPSTGMFAYWRCPDGTVQGNVEQTQINLQAISFGMVDLDRARQILDGIDRQMSLQHLQLIPENFIPLAPTTEDWTGDHFSDGIEDGSVYPLMTEEYMRAAAIVGERNQSLSYLDRTASRYTQDGFNGFSFVHSTSLAPSTGEAWFPSNANGAAGLFSDMLGIQPTADGVTIAPNIPKQMDGTHVSKTIHADGKLTVSYRSELEETVQYSAGGQAVTMQWSGQKPKASYAVSDNGARRTVRADSMGVVRYRFTGTGQHSLSLIGGNAAGYTLPATPNNLAYGKAVTTSSSLEGPLPGDPPSKAWSAKSLVDGMPYSVDDAMGWASNSGLTENHIESATIDLGSAQQVGNVTLWADDYDAKPSSIGANFPTDFTIAVSTDGKTWTTQVAESDYPKPTGLGGQSFGFTTPVRARYIRVEGTGLTNDGGSYRMSLAEIQAFSTTAGASSDR
ncbi:discoidin domain-containing protein [Humibacter sp. RRB41]|uniref:discoidin domain-containing protein n=1 Tax=Humibacter sp. RRB41 TaxID=2919946 RepID=UPI001FA94AB6|nr:discoidin domain-containing protein [Humibacter sp. RRB41]